MSSQFDAIEVEVLGNHLLSIAEEMTSVMIRAAFSPAIRDRHDCSSALLTVDGETVASAADIPIHLGALVGIVRDAIQHYGLGNLRDGDVLIANDPYQGSSTHLNDISAIAPVFLGGEIALFACVTAHHSDVGGMMPGSETVEAQSIYQEGLRLPCVLASSGGQLKRDVFEIVALNSRTPEERSGDLRAQIGAVTRGGERFLQLAEKYGAQKLASVIPHLLDATERRFRRQLATLPDGTWTAAEELDPSRSTGEPVRIAVRITKLGEQVEIDFTGTTRQLAEGRNAPFAATVAAVNYALRSLVDPDLPANSGFFRALRLSVPQGCVLNPRQPYPVSTRASTAQHVAGVIFKAVADAWPDRVIAGCDGRRKVIFAGEDTTRERYFVYHESNAGGLGAHANGDGIDGAMAHVIQILNLPAEALELAYPLAVTRLELLQDSGGAGRWRGGAGVRRDYEVLGPGARCSLVSERSRARMWGLAGGEPGGLGRFVVNPGRTSEREIDSTRETSVELRHGDVLSVQTAGGGGFGDPFERDVERVLRDLCEERISQDAAVETYGVRVSRAGDGSWHGSRPVSRREAAVPS